MSLKSLEPLLLKNGRAINGIIQGTINKLLNYFQINLSNTGEYLSLRLGEIYVVVLMAVNYLLMYDQINQNNRVNDVIGRCIDYLHDT